MSTEPNAETTGVQVANVPVADLDYLKPFAVRNAYGPTRGATMKYALVELAKRCRREDVEQAKPNPGLAPTAPGATAPQPALCHCAELAADPLGS